ncbi:MAG: MBL fold metallo-hydrolase [Gammaproteobacteria bacterium]|nr:MBL fold metallo-hydrolase [Gammaproteobacteria bacterium]
MASLTFYGATAGVTGSAYLIETQSSTILLECGLVQGGHEAEKANSEAFPFDIAKLDAVLLSHAHLDHSGRIPQLAAEGYNGPVFMTYATCELLEILHKDAASLQMRDAEWENKRQRRAAKPLIEPIYDLDDVENALTLYQGIPYGRRQPVADGIEVCFRDAGHILGSAIVELFFTEDGVERKLVFSGDLGNRNAALLRDPETVTEADVVLMESTYGDRNHRPIEQTLEQFEKIIVEASENGGNILIPSFAVGRTQEIIFYLGKLYQKGLLKQQAIYLDSPMAIAATEVYHRYQNIFNSEDNAALRQGESGSLHTFLPTLRYSVTTAESIAVNQINAGAIIIAGSGMCNGGRIRHHFKHNLWRHNAHVVFVGYQAYGTPGRAIIDGAKTFRIGDEEIAVKATIHTLGGFSAHASQSQLVDWVSNFNTAQPQLYLVHGEAEAKSMLQKRLSTDGWQANIPEHGECISI